MLKSGWIRTSTRLAIYLRDGLACVYCGSSGHTVPLTLDHVIPRMTPGGSNSPNNLVTACRRCNEVRGRCRSPHAFGDAIKQNPDKFKRIVKEQLSQPLTQHIKNRANALLRERPLWITRIFQVADPAMLDVDWEAEDAFLAAGAAEATGGALPDAAGYDTDDIDYTYRSLPGADESAPF